MTGETPGEEKRRSVTAPLLIGAALVALAIVAIRRANNPREEETAFGVTPANEPRGKLLADFFELGDFALVDQDGRPFTKASLAGKIWVVDFFFTSCPGPCITLTSKMRALVAALGAESDVGFASISVDPGSDTPDVLTRYAAVHGGGTSRWRFLTGTQAQVKDVCHAFQAALGEKGATGDISHSTYLYVVDRHAHLRAIHDTQIDDEWKPATLHSVKLLLEQQPAPR